MQNVRDRGKAGDRERGRGRGRGRGKERLRHRKAEREREGDRGTYNDMIFLKKGRVSTLNRNSLYIDLNTKVKF